MLRTPQISCEAQKCWFLGAKASFPPASVFDIAAFRPYSEFSCYLEQDFICCRKNPTTIKEQQAQVSHQKLSYLQNE